MTATVDLPVLSPLAQAISQHRRKLAAAQEAKRKTMLDRYGVIDGTGAGQIKIKMYVSPWYEDEHGNRWRFIKQQGDLTACLAS